MGDRISSMGVVMLAAVQVRTISGGAEMGGVAGGSLDFDHLGLLLLPGLDHRRLHLAGAELGRYGVEGDVMAAPCIRPVWPVFTSPKA